MKNTSKTIFLVLAMILVSLAGIGCGSSNDTASARDPFTSDMMMAAKNAGYKYLDIDEMKALYDGIADMNSDFMALSETLDPGVYTVMNKDELNVLYSSQVSALADFPYNDKMTSATLITKGHLAASTEYSMVAIAFEFDSADSAKAYYDSQSHQINDLFEKYPGVANIMLDVNDVDNGVTYHCCRYGLNGEDSAAETFYNCSYLAGKYVLAFTGFDGASNKSATPAIVNLCNDMNLVCPT